MRNINFKILAKSGLYVTFLLFFSSIGAKKSEISSWHQTKMIINDREFVHRQEVLGVNSEEFWSIEGKPCDAEQFGQEMILAENEEVRLAIEAEENRRRQEEDFRMQGQILVQKKLLNNYVASIEGLLKSIHDNSLEPFLLFNESTISDKDYLNSIESIFIPEGKELLATYNEDVDLKKLTQLSDQLELIPHKLQELYYATVNNAISVCNDTKTLKKLLDIVSRA